MIKKTLIAIILLWTLISCKTTMDSETFEFSKFTNDEDVSLESEVEIPDVELFISAPFASVNDDHQFDSDEVNIPQESVPELEIEEVVSPIITENIGHETLEASVIASAIVDREKKDEPELMQHIREIPSEKDVAKALSPVSVVPDIIKISKDLQTQAGKDIVIELDQEGWIFNGGDSSSIVLKKREFTGGETRFIFSIDNAGEFLLTFTLQNLSTGESESVEYAVSVESTEDSFNTPIVIEPELENETSDLFSVVQDDILTAVREENIPDLVASFNQLITEEEPVDSQVLVDAFKLLERQGGYDQYLVDLAENVYSLYPYDNLSAELLYKAALTVEKPGPGQNIEKALSLFKQVRDHFPISIYCDKSEERIRYLERHFMKIY